VRTCGTNTKHVQDNKAITVDLKH